MNKLNQQIPPVCSIYYADFKHMAERDKIVNGGELSGKVNFVLSDTC